MDGGKDVGPPGGHDGSVVASLLDPHRPTFLFGCTPPSRKMPRAKVREICKKFLARTCAGVGWIHRVRCAGRVLAHCRGAPFPFRTLWDSSWYAGIVTSESNKQCVVYKAAPATPAFSDWLGTAWKRMATYPTVGALQAGNTPGLRQRTHASSRLQVPGVQFHVCIAERHVKNRCMSTSLIKKMQWGAEWFITQGIYDPQPMIAVIKDYSRRCRELKLAKEDSSHIHPLREEEDHGLHQVAGDASSRSCRAENIWRFGSDCAKRQRGEQERQVANTHGKDLRATVSPKTKKTRKELRVKTPVEISCEIMCENLRTILTKHGRAGCPWNQCGECQRLP